MYVYVHICTYMYIYVYIYVYSTVNPNSNKNPIKRECNKQLVCTKIIFENIRVESFVQHIYRYSSTAKSQNLLFKTTCTTTKDFVVVYKYVYICIYIYTRLYIVYVYIY